MNIVRVFIIAVAIVCICRGVWGLLDLDLFPNDLAVSLIMSIAIGVAILLYFGKNMFNLLAGA